MAPLFDVCVHVFSRPEIRSPESNAIHEALTRLGFDAVRSVRVGRTFALVLQASDKDTARTYAEEISCSLLANPVMDTFEVEVLTLPEAGRSAGAERRP